MTKIFEDFFSELQADMVSICLEYVNDRADKIYIYCSYEEGMISSDFFYRINNKVVERHKLNDALSSAEKDVFVYDVSVERQRGVIKIINNDIEEIFHLCKKHGREMPTEMKIIYDVKLNKLTANYNYELVHTNHPVKTADDISMEWFEQIQAEKSY
ncbi:DUF600 domain-containing protein [Paenibacillus sp. EKM211P]|uniref:DUF600 domain-containing protein n=1 Tax=Paenibacillus sp. EKM211P TaxID=1683679 RepID=UPI0013E99C29|nr:DUF600 domain-containing protein [Paenibacillus sp. EKM211P]KAF6586064.1 DUF600 domain-containing protein [Paenibacillus sp. EKM211P]